MPFEKYVEREKPSPVVPHSLPRYSSSVTDVGMVPLRSACSALTLSELDFPLDDTDDLPSSHAGRAAKVHDKEKKSDSDDEDEDDKKSTTPGEKTQQTKQLIKAVTDDDSEERGRLIEAEERALGAVSWSVYWSYCRRATVPLTLGMLLGCTLRQGMRMLTDYWLVLWADASIAGEIRHEGQSVTSSPRGSFLSAIEKLTYNASETLAPAAHYDLDYYMTVYGVLNAITMVLLFSAICFLELTALNASRRLHRALLCRLISAPARFFDVTPTGRIVNRLAGDTHILDEKMPPALDMVLFCSLFVIGGVIMNVLTNPWFILPSIPVIAVYILVQRFYIASSRELQRLDNLSKSPILSHFSETLAGLTTIRAYRCKERFAQKNYENVDANNKALMFLYSANAWMGFRLDMVGAVIVLAATLSSISSGLSSVISPSVVGISIAYAVLIAQFVNYMMRSASELEMYFNSVERQEYYTKVKAEKDFHEPIVTVDEEWPSKGEIIMEGVSLGYSDTLGPVIRDLSLNIPAGSKLGVCGRTGSGKSSLSLGLFRLIVQSAGTITIDGVDISHVPLHTLRSRLAIIPQDPVLFNASVRFNIDPEERCSDAELWSALEQSQLKATISSLDEIVAEAGANYSVGQRQLFCMARAIVRKCRIVVLDEATASVDQATDSAVQDIILSTFQHCTVITIAHRVSTILACDKIVVLEDGKVLEEGSPQDLSNSDTKFAAMLSSHSM